MFASDDYSKMYTLNWRSDSISPLANAGADHTVGEDTIVTFDGSRSSDNVGMIGYTWTFTDLSLRTLTGVNPTYMFTNPGAYVVTLNVTDKAGNYATDTVTITVLDVTSPIAEAEENQTADEDTLVTLDGSKSTDNVEITSHSWTFTDVTPQTLLGATVTYNFTNPGTYVITLNVTDAAGNFATDTIVITAKDVTPPVADAGTDRTVKLNTQVSFDASGSSDNAGIVNYEWDFGDETARTGKTTTHTYKEPKTYTATLTVKDEAGNSNSDTITVTVEPLTFFEEYGNLHSEFGCCSGNCSYAATLQRK